MSATSKLLEDLALIGATVRPEGDRLILRAGSTTIPADLVARVKQAKSEILEALTAASDVRPRGLMPPPPAVLVPNVFAEALAHLERRCPDYIEPEQWRQAVEDGRRFLAQWGSQAAALGWTTKELFGLHEPPAKPHPSYDRRARYDESGLLWLLNGLPVMMLTEATAAIETKTGTVITYRKLNKPGLGPIGDSLDDLV
jgi:hypothetical protein